MPNYIRESFNTDLDFGTGEWSVGAWVNVPVTLPVANFPVISGELVTNSSLTTQGDSNTVAVTNASPINLCSVVAGKTYRVNSVLVSKIGYCTLRVNTSASNGFPAYGFNPTSGLSGSVVYTALVSGTLAFVADESTCNQVFDYISVVEVGSSPIADRAFSSGPKISLGINGVGFLTATAFDGTTTRTVTTTAAYNTATWLKAEAQYKTDGSLGIVVNGQEVAVTRGTPLLSLSSIQYNLVYGSEDFGVAPMWTAFPAASITKNAITVGSIGLSLVIPSTANSAKQSITGFAVAGGPLTVSLYCKAAGYRYLQVIDGMNGAFGIAVFDAIAGTFVQNTYGAATSVVDVGNSVFKITITSTNPATQNLHIGIVNSATGNTNYTTVAFAGDGTSGMYIGGIQRVSGSVERTYQRVGLAGDFAFSAPLTIGNSYAADAPFPGSIALLKASATVPTAEQMVWMYEQEKQMFRDGAQVTLPDANAIVDLTYDDLTDKWMAVSATNESEWSGLVRTSVTAAPAGSYSKITATSGVQLQARTTTNPGVDITIPAANLREELLKDAEAANKLNAQLAIFDYVGGFTANTTSGATSIVSAAGITYPVSYIGARVTGTGIPTDTFILGINGTTLYLSKAATATGTAVQLSFTDFILAVGYEAKVVLSAGLVKTEGTTKDYVRLFDGFKETIRFGTAPGYNTAVQIQATRSIQ